MPILPQNMFGIDDQTGDEVGALPKLKLLKEVMDHVKTTENELVQEILRGLA